MSLVTTTQVREHVPTDLTDPALQRLIDDVEEELNEKVGDVNTESEEFYKDAVTALLFLRRPAVAVSTVTEYDGSTPTVLASSDYELRMDGKVLARLDTGTNASDAWGDRVLVTYIPQVGIARRIGAIIKLVRLDVQDVGLQSASDGDHSETRIDVTKERRRIIEGLRSRHRLFS